MHIYKLFSILSLFLIINSSISFSQSDTKRIQFDGNEYYLYVVKKGEGLYRIGVNFGVSMNEILKANSDIGEQLTEGQVIRIPVIEGRNSDTNLLIESKEYIYHTVEKGQTAFFVSRKYGITLEELYENNFGAENGLIVGAILKIPYNSENKLTKTTSQNVNEKNYITHTVRPKETLYGISHQYSTTVAEIIEQNPALKDGALSIGSEIRIKKAQEIENLTDDSSQSGEENIVTEDYIYHLIENGDTFSSISKKYLIDVSDLKYANPNLNESDFKVGYLIRVPKIDASGLNASLSEQKKNKDWFISHKVGKRETLFGISQMYHTSIDVIKKVNPTVNFSNLRKGEILMIPTDNWFAAKALSGNLESEEVIDEADLFDFKECNLNQILGYQTPIKVSLLLPFNASVSKNYYSTFNDTVSFTQSMTQTALKSKAFVEFYSGALLALDKLKQEGVSVDLSVIDIPSNWTITQALNNPSLIESDLIIGPGLGNEISRISEFSRQNKIPLVYPISNNSNGELLKNPYLFQVNTPDTLLFDSMVKDIVKQSQNGNLIVILPPDEEKDALLFLKKIKMEAMKTFLNSDDVNYKEYRMGSDDLMAIQSIISSDKSNYIVIPSVAASEISKIVPILKGVKEKTKTNIKIFGRSEWLRMQTIDPADIHSLETTIYTPLKLDYTDSDTRRFIEKYRIWYSTEPHSISPFFQYSDANSNFSRFGIWGYDVTYYFINAIAHYGKDFAYCLNKIEHKEIQFNFNFNRISNWGGYYNSGFNKLVFYPNYRVTQTPISE